MSDSHLRNLRGKRSDPKALGRFVEQLSWLLSSNEDLDFRALRKAARELYLTDRKPTRSIKRLAPKNPNISFLVGALPGLFNNEAFFSTNEEIAEFAKTALRVSIPRWEKKSKFELIGHVVCNTAKLGDKRLSILVRALSRIIDDERQAKEVFAKKREKGASWNEVIQQLYEKD